MVWDISRGTIACELGGRGTGHSSAVRGVCFAGASRLLSVGDDRQAIVWDCGPSACVLSRFECQSAGPALAVLSAAESTIVAGGALLAQWDTSGKQIRAFSGGHAAPVSMLAQAGDALVSAAGDRFICVWRAHGKEILSAALPVGRLTASSTGVAAVSEDGSQIFLWREGDDRSNAKAAQASYTLEAGMHPVLDVRWNESAVLVARLVAGRPQFARVAPSEPLPGVEDATTSGTGEKGLGALVKPVTLDGLSAFAVGAAPIAPADAGRDAGGAGTVVGIIRQALLTRDNVLLGEALNAPVRVADSCRALDARLAAPLLAALAARLEVGTGKPLLSLFCCHVCVFFFPLLFP